MPDRRIIPTTCHLSPLKILTIYPHFKRLEICISYFSLEPNTVKLLTPATLLDHKGEFCDALCSESVTTELHTCTNSHEDQLSVYWVQCYMGSLWTGSCG